MISSHSESLSRPVHLVGSIPLQTAAEVLEAVAATLGPFIERVPDGETGIRANWIGWQHRVFDRQDALEPGAERERDYQLNPPYRFKPGAGPADIDLGELGFAREAIASYAMFKRAKANGSFRPDCRFQVCLPTPFAPVYSFISYRDQGAVEPLYEASMRAELDKICATIPHHELAVQWDVATEMSIFEQLYDVPFLGDNADAGLIERLCRLGEAVPAEVALGYHLCYGDMNHRHWKEPDDTGVLVRGANGISDAVDRPITWLHMPVPVARDDAAYFSPLANLMIHAETMLFLGLVHYTDGLEGALRRITAADRVVSGYGIGAECGFGRRDPATILDLLRLHAAVAREL